MFKWFPKRLGSFVQRSVAVMVPDLFFFMAVDHNRSAGSTAANLNEIETVEEMAEQSGVM